jgi:hypothetical protein
MPGSGTSVPEVVPEVPLLDEDDELLDDEDDELLLLELDEPLEEPLDEPLDDEDDELPVEELPVDEVMLPEVPPDDELELDEEELDDELDELDDDELALLPELEVTLPEDDVTLPDELVTLPEVVEVVLVTPPVEVLTPPVEVLTPPVVLVLVIPPVEVETPPVVVEVDEPPLPPELVEVDEPVVELSISISMTTPEVLPVVPLELDEPEVEVLVVVDRLTLPPPPPLPPKKPPKNPPPKPPPKPPEPPITIGWPLPPPLTRWPCGRGSAGSGKAATSTSGSTSITRRMRRVSRSGRRRSTTRRALWRSFTSTSCGRLSDLYDVVAACGSATCTAPPAIRAVPAAAADNFARANLIDMPGLSSHFPVNRWGPMPALRFFQACNEPATDRYRNAERAGTAAKLSLFGRGKSLPRRSVPQWNRKPRFAEQRLKREQA